MAQDNLIITKRNVDIEICSPDLDNELRVSISTYQGEERIWISIEDCKEIVQHLQQFIN